MRRLVLSVALPILTGCSAAAKKPLVETAFSDETQRRQTFEATLRVLDENPEYVDEFVALVLEHPKTLDRFLADTAVRLSDEELARKNALHLTNEPRSLRTVLVTTLEAAKDKPAAQQAISEAIAERPELSAAAIASRPETIEPSLHALLEVVLRRAETREAFLRALANDRNALAELIVHNPELAKAFVASLAKAGVARVRESVDPD